MFLCEGEGGEEGGEDSKESREVHFSFVLYFKFLLVR